MRLQCVMAGDMNMKDLQQETKQYLAVPHPQQSITVLSQINVGDVLEPLTEGTYTTLHDREPMSFSDKLLIYSISCPNPYFNMPSEVERGSTAPPATTIVVIRYESDTIDFDLQDIVAVMCVGHQRGLSGLLTGFRLLGNIIHRMV